MHRCANHKHPRLRLRERSLTPRDTAWRIGVTVQAKQDIPGHLIAAVGGELELRALSDEVDDDLDHVREETR